MNSAVEQIYDRNNDLWGEPQVYQGVNIHPIKLKDMKYHNLFRELFMYPKNTIPEKEIIKMSYLKFLLTVVPLSSGIKISIDEMRNKVIDFLQYATKEEKVGIEIKSHPSKKDAFILEVNVSDIILTERDFDNIREIVLEQNCFSIEYVEGFISDLEESLAFVNRHAKDRTLEDEVFTFCVLTNKSIKEVEEYTLHQFRFHLERVMLLEEYRLYKPLVVSGQITLKYGEIEHYAKHIAKSGRYDSILIKRDDFEEEIKELQPSKLSKKKE